MNLLRNGCECCGQRDATNCYIDCQHCRKTLCLLCISVHPSPEICKTASFRCSHGQVLSLKGLKSITGQRYTGRVWSTHQWR